MKTPVIAAVLFSAVICSAQDSKQSPFNSLFMATKPQATVVVREHKTGADMVEITMLDASYPLDLLRNQLKVLDAELKGNIRGVQVYKLEPRPNDPKTTYVKAAFAIDGLIDREKGLLRLQPLARAFAGAPKPYTIEAFAVIFDGERPTSQTMQQFPSDSVIVQGISSDNPVQIEYRILLRTQDPNKIVIPERFEPQKTPEQQRPSKSSVPMGLVVSLVGLASISGGALVYFTLLRSGNRKR